MSRTLVPFLRYRLLLRLVLRQPAVLHAFMICCFVRRKEWNLRSNDEFHDNVEKITTTVRKNRLPFNGYIRGNNHQRMAFKILQSMKNVNQLTRFREVHEDLKEVSTEEREIQKVRENFVNDGSKLRRTKHLAKETGKGEVKDSISFGTVHKCVKYKGR